MTSILLAMSLALTASLQDSFKEREGAYVQIDSKGVEGGFPSESAVRARFAPCSTFKIWNAAIGLETGHVKNVDETFWKWDGVQRDTVAEWNQDQTLRSAFQVSCVPAFQALARQIGEKPMTGWLARISYGDENITSGVDVFWLPAKGRKALLISAEEQARLMARLASGDVPFSAETQKKLKDIMRVKKTERGILYGKTGSSGSYGWFVGYVESSGETVAFACRLMGKGVMGKDARLVVERVLEEQGLL